MPKKPKEKCEETGEQDDASTAETWAKDQANRSYYYDDAHGYEKYTAEDDDENENAPDEKRRERDR